MAAFDPAQAAREYATLDTEELVRIAYLERDYLPEAKAVAASELDRRGIPKDRRKVIRQVRAEIRSRRRAAKIMEHEGFHRIEALKWKIGSTTLIAALWMFALFAPVTVKDWKPLANWATAVLLIVWGVSVFGAVKKAKQGVRRQLYLVLIIPAALALAGAALRMAI